MRIRPARRAAKFSHAPASEVSIRALVLVDSYYITDRDYETNLNLLVNSKNNLRFEGVEVLLVPIAVIPRVQVGVSVVQFLVNLRICQNGPAKKGYAIFKSLM